MSKPRKLKLVKLEKHEEQPHLAIVGHGANTFLWVGDKNCYAFSRHNSRELHSFAQALIKRVMEPYKKAEKK